MLLSSNSTSILFGFSVTLAVGSSVDIIFFDSGCLVGAAVITGTLVGIVFFGSAVTVLFSLTRFVLLCFFSNRPDLF